MDPKKLVSIFTEDKEIYKKTICTLDPPYIEELALYCAHSFLSNNIGWDSVSKLLNFTMSCYGFEKAPKLFWDVYLAFEDAEISSAPEDLTRGKLAQIQDVIKIL